MADRVGVISKGELILVEEKAELMHKLGKKQLTLQLLQEPLDGDSRRRSPATQLALLERRRSAAPTPTTRRPSATGIAAAARRRSSDAGIGFKDLADQAELARGHLRQTGE